MCEEAERGGGIGGGCCVVGVVWWVLCGGCVGCVPFERLIDSIKEADRELITNHTGVTTNVSISTTVGRSRGHMGHMLGHVLGGMAWAKASSTTRARVCGSAWWCWG